MLGIDSGSSWYSSSITTFENRKGGSRGRRGGSGSVPALLLSLVLYHAKAQTRMTRG